MQEKLAAAYEAWRAALSINETEIDHLGPPLLVSPPASYQQAEKKLLIYGQETLGWAWTHDSIAKYPAYGNRWEFEEIASLADFKKNDDAVRALMHGYELFDFSKAQPANYNAPFFRAFREVSAASKAEPVWSNVIKTDYQKADAANMSIWSASEELRETVVEQQADIIREEAGILKPDACVFFSGPYYDAFITASFDGCVFEAVDDLPVRQLAKVQHELLPENTYRTYHPAYLSRSGRWSILQRIAERL